ncbi:hypothetical protein FRC06_007289 [Ceratobasidium sp. 370]|nr:hypothetical protein FRC06_007289 [Ceratobasidium sp. 370]
MADQIIRAIAGSPIVPAQIRQVANAVHATSQVVSLVARAVKAAKDKHHDAQSARFQTWIRNAEARSRAYNEQRADVRYPLLSPHFFTLILEILSSSAVSWVLTHETDIPGGALACGLDIDGNPLYVCRTFHRGGVHFGKAGRHFENGAMFGHDGKEFETEYYEVLVAHESVVRWETASYPFRVQTHNGGMLVEGGCEHDGSLLFVARAFYWGGLHPGKTSEALKGADITFAGKEYVSGFIGSHVLQPARPAATFQRIT